MKCPFCPKEFDEKKSFKRFIGKGKIEYESNEDYDKHVRKHHFKPTKNKKIKK